jgi:hypothetical protein
MRPSERGPVLDLIANVYARRGFAWWVIQSLALPLLIIAWLCYWVGIQVVARRWLRQQAAGADAWHRDRNDRLLHPEKYRGRD